ncbi:MAG TPA: hypothetical protein VHC97_11915 [Thermoanaerobaculia bacterium]|nr:hypothetical protein [Thermoanaerobaculia bacterium]
MDTVGRRGGARRLARLALVALLLTLAARAGWTQGPAPTPVPPDSDFDVVQVDLEGQLFNRVLPFDVPFILTGMVPTGVTRLEVRCWVLPPDRGKSSGSPVGFSAEVLRAQPDGDCWPGGALVWRNTIDPAASNPTFRLMVPRLEAENFYQFKFSFEKKVSPEDAQAFAREVRGVVDGFLWGDPNSTADLPLSGDLTVAEMQAIRTGLIQALQDVTSADRVTEPGSVLNPDTPFEMVRDEFNRLLRPVRNVQGQINDTAEDYEDEIADLNPLLAQLRADPMLQKLASALAARAASDPSAQDHAEEVAAALAVGDAPVLLRSDRQSAAALASFVQKSAPYYADAAAKMGKLQDLLANKLIGADGTPKPFAQPLVTAGQLAMEDLTRLAALGQPTQPVGSASRALARVGGILSDRLAGLLASRASAVAAVAEAYRTHVEGLSIIAGSTTGSFQTQSRNYISADTGIVCTPELGECNTYAGSNIYFRPINKAAPLNQFGGFFQTLDRRVSLTIGLTATGVGDGKTRDDLFGTQSLLLGLGARMTNSMRLTAGGLLFKELDPNPLVNDETLTTTYFLSFSFDIDVAPMLQGLSGLFKTGLPGQ